MRKVLLITMAGIVSLTTTLSVVALSATPSLAQQSAEKASEPKVEPSPEPQIEPQETTTPLDNPPDHRGHSGDDPKPPADAGDINQPVEVAPGGDTGLTILIECVQGYYPVYGPDPSSTKDDKCVPWPESPTFCDKDGIDNNGDGEVDEPREPCESSPIPPKPPITEDDVQPPIVEDDVQPPEDDVQPPEDDVQPPEDAITEDDVQQDASASEGVKTARDHQIRDENGNVVATCEPGYHFSDGDIEFTPTGGVDHPPGDSDDDRFGGNDDCVPDWQCAGESGVIVQDPENYDYDATTAGDVMDELGDCVGDWWRFWGYHVWNVFDEWFGEPLIWLGDEIGPLGLPLKWLGYGLSFFGEASARVLWGFGDMADSVVDEVGNLVDEVVDTVEDAWDEVASWF